MEEEQRCLDCSDFPVQMELMLDFHEGLVDRRQQAQKSDSDASDSFADASVAVHRKASKVAEVDKRRSGSFQAPYSPSSSSADPKPCTRPSVLRGISHPDLDNEAAESTLELGFDTSVAPYPVSVREA
jgi:hypothetical protein